MRTLNPLISITSGSSDVSPSPKNKYLYLLRLGEHFQKLLFFESANVVFLRNESGMFIHQVGSVSFSSRCLAAHVCPGMLSRTHSGLLGFLLVLPFAWSLTLPMCSSCVLAGVALFIHVVVSCFAVAWSLTLPMCSSCVLAGVALFIHVVSCFAVAWSLKL